MTLGLTHPLTEWVNEYQESCWVIKRGRRITLTYSPPSVSRLSRKCGILDVWKPCGPARSVTKLALLLLYLLMDIVVYCQTSSEHLLKTLLCSSVCFLVCGLFIHAVSNAHRVDMLSNGGTREGKRIVSQAVVVWFVTLSLKFPGGTKEKCGTRHCCLLSIRCRGRELSRTPQALLLD
jgi:hypothetical protein